jgi:hypothetical protein
MNKISRILAANKIDPAKANILNIENNILYVEYEGIQYRIDGMNKTILNEKVEDKIDDTLFIEIKRPRGWQFRAIFVDSEGNVYHKGVLQPELKGTLTPSI